MDKKPLNIEVMLGRIREAISPYPPAAMFQLADEGFNTLFEQLVGCIISIRTFDEVTLPVARRLFSHARTPAQMAALSAAEIDKLIGASTFHARKAEQILALSKRSLQEFNGGLPCDLEILMSFSGIGVKCTHLSLGIACNIPLISVDIHVHRVTNRWGYVQTTSPEKTTLALTETLPPAFYVEINRLLVPFGKHICTGRLPRCSTCPVLSMCRQAGVVSHR